MPYRGTNAKRNVVHDKSRATIRSGSRDNFLAEKKEREHELASAKEKIAKFRNDGFHFKSKEVIQDNVRVVFANERNEEKQIEFLFPDNFDILKEYFDKVNAH